MVPRRWVMTINWVFSATPRIYRAKRATLASSKAASISSMTTKGVGRTFKMAKYRAMATKAFSPPDSRVMIFKALPGGCTLISIPQLRMSSGSSSSRVALPPPKSSRKVSPKAWLMVWNSRWKMAFISAVIAVMMSSSSFLACSTSSRWSVR